MTEVGFVIDVSLLITFSFIQSQMRYSLEVCNSSRKCCFCSKTLAKASFSASMKEQHEGRVYNSKDKRYGLVALALPHK